MAYEYTVIAAPERSEKSKAARTAADRYALTLAAELNRMAADGWDYVRAETLPSEERSGLTGRVTVYHNVLVFRRKMSAPNNQPVPQPLAESQPAAVAIPMPEAQASDETPPADAGSPRETEQASA